jgi:hypothetical protein
MRQWLEQTHQTLCNTTVPPNETRYSQRANLTRDRARAHIVCVVIATPHYCLRAIPADYKTATSRCPAEIRLAPRQQPHSYLRSKRTTNMSLCIVAYSYLCKADLDGRDFGLRATLLCPAFLPAPWGRDRFSRCVEDFSVQPNLYDSYL